MSRTSGIPTLPETLVHTQMLRAIVSADSEVVDVAGACGTKATVDKVLGNGQIINPERYTAPTPWLS